MAIDRRLLTYINWGLVAATLLLFWVGIGNLYSAQRRQGGGRHQPCPVL